MMEIKAFVVILVTTSVIAYVFIRIFQDDFFKEETDTCPTDDVCVRFCCSDPKTCSNGSHFDIHHKDEALHLPKKFTPIRGSCKHHYKNEDPWQLTKVKL